MLRRCLRWTRRHRMASAGLGLVLGFALLNVVAYRHAYHMLHFQPAGSRTAAPPELSPAGKLWALVAGVSIPRPANYRTPDSFQLPFEIRRFPSLDGTPLEAWFIPRADAKGVALLFHGYANVKASFLPEAAAFRRLGYASLLVDFRGSGGSGGDETTVGVREADDVAAAFGYAREHWPGRPIVVFGQSMGSAAVLRAMALHGVRPAAAVLETPFDRLVSTVGHRFQAMGLPAFPAAQLLVFWGGVQCGFSGFAHNPVDYAHSADCPVMLLQGDRDPFITTEEARSIFDALPGPKQCEVFSGLGHESCCCARPKEWSRLVGAFLDRHAR